LVRTTGGKKMPIVIGARRKCAHCYRCISGHFKEIV
jgi:uncharacterized Fe-S cluster protein YjdI